MISAVIALVGVGIIAAVLYANLTLDLATEYEAFVENCSSLPGQTGFTDLGLGWSPSELNESHAQVCANTTFPEYQTARLQSNWTTPFNPVQWAGYLGVGCLVLGGGLVLFRHSQHAGASDSEP